MEGAVGGGIASASVSGSGMLVEVAVDGAFDVGFMRWEAAGVCGRLGAIGAVEQSLWDGTRVEELYAKVMAS